MRSQKKTLLHILGLLRSFDIEMGRHTVVYPFEWQNTQIQISLSNDSLIKCFPNVT